MNLTTAAVALLAAALAWAAAWSTSPRLATALGVLAFSVIAAGTWHVLNSSAQWRPRV